MKKAISSQTVNVIFGILFVVIFFISYIMVFAQLDNTMNNRVRSYHLFNSYEAYAPILLKANATTFFEFVDISKQNNIFSSVQRNFNYRINSVHLKRSGNDFIPSETVTIQGTYPFGADEYSVLARSGSFIPQAINSRMFDVSNTFVSPSVIYYDDDLLPDFLYFFDPLLMTIFYTYDYRDFSYCMFDQDVNARGTLRNNRGNRNLELEFNCILRGLYDE